MAYTSCFAGIRRHGDQMKISKQDKLELSYHVKKIKMPEKLVEDRLRNISPHLLDRVSESIILHLILEGSSADTERFSCLSNITAGFGKCIDNGSLLHDLR